VAAEILRGRGGQYTGVEGLLHTRRWPGGAGIPGSGVTGAGGWKAPHGQRKARVDYAAALATHERDDEERFKILGVGGLVSC